MKRKWDVLELQSQKQCIDEIISRVQDIDGEEVGVIVAQDIIDIVTNHYGPAIYNAGVRDAKKVVQGKTYDLETEIDLLEQ